MRELILNLPKPSSVRKQPSSSDNTGRSDKRPCGRSPIMVNQLFSSLANIHKPHGGGPTPARPPDLPGPANIIILDPQTRSRRKRYSPPLGNLQCQTLTLMVTSQWKRQTTPPPTATKASSSNSCKVRSLLPVQEWRVIDLRYFIVDNSCVLRK